MLGAEGIKQYQRLRLKGIENLIRLQIPATTSNTPRLHLERGDYFHNGSEVLREVNDWHTYLRHSMRVTDTVTSQVLNLLGQRNGMLVGDPKKRMKSKDVWDELEKISHRLPDPVSDVPTAILDFLRDGDDQNLSLNLAQSSTSTIIEPTEPKAARQERRDKVFKFLDGPLVDNYRSYLKPPSTRSTFPVDNSQTFPGLGDQPLPAGFLRSSGSPSGFGFGGIKDPDLSHGIPLQLRRPGTMMSESSNWTGSTKDIRSPLTKKEHPQDLFQAREDMWARDLQRREKDLFARLRTKPKDPRLSNYWGDRDLVSKFTELSYIGTCSDFTDNHLQKFIVDNAESMQTHWGKVKFVLETLLLKAEGLDPDGVDLTFTLGDVKVDTSKERTIDKIMKKLDNDEAKPNQGGYTSMQTSLQDIFDDYFRKLKPSNTKKSKVTIIVLTDGIWRGTMNKEDVNETIVAFARRLEETLGRPPKERPVSIEFVQFGRDPEATFRLKRLDDELKHEGIM